MSWYPIAYLPPQLENASGMPYSGAVLKAYAAGSSTNIPMATDYTGVTTAATMLLNASGYPTYLGTIVIPHLQQNYKLALYPDQASADANSGAIWTVDNVQIAPSTNSSFIQYFDGDGVTPTFTLSQNFGTDENILMVFADRAIPNYVTNGDFATDTIWAKGAGWTISAGVATASGAISTAITQNANTPIIQGQSYTVEFTVTASAGTLTPSIGGNAGTTRGAGTWRETIIAGSTQVLAFTGAAFTGTLDNVSIKPTYSAQRLINRPDEYTLVGNQLTLNNIPPSGTKNVIVFAPSQLLGAANNAAAAAATSEANALSYKNSASADAAATSALYDSFDDRYLGAKSSDPTLDNDGNALLTGALYWNTVSNVMKVYSGTVWAAAYVGAGGFLVAANNLSDVAVPATARGNLSAAKSGENTDITSLGSITSINGGQFAFRNAIINGAMGISQQNGTASVALTTSVAYGSCDRWAAAQGGTAAGTLAQVIGNAPSGLRYSLRIGRNAAATSTNIIQLQQAITTDNSIRFAGGSAVLSFWVKAGANYSGGNLTANVYSGTGTNQSAATMAGSWTGSTTPITGAQAITTTWTRYSFTGTIPANCTQLGVYFGYTPSGTAGADDNIYITGVQLETGSVATPFENIPDLDIQRCFAHAESGTVCGVSSAASGTFIQRSMIQFKAKKFISPTMSFAYVSGTSQTPTVAANAIDGCWVAWPSFTAAGQETVCTYFARSEL